MWNPILGRAGYGQHRNDFSPGGSKFPWCKRDDGLYDRFQNRFFCQHTDHRNGTGALHFYKPESGSRRNPKGKKGKKLCLNWAWIFSAGLLLVLWSAGRMIIHIFTDDRDIVNMTYEYIRILSIAYFLASYFVILNGYIRGTGNTVLPMFSSVFGYWAARLPAAYVLKEIAGYMGICLAIPAGWIGSCIIVRFYIHSKKFTVFMKRQEEAEYERTDRKNQAIYRS